MKKYLIAASRGRNGKQHLEIGGGIYKRILRKTRNEEEKKRRHLYGDKGAKFSQTYRIAEDECSNTITTVEKDNYVIEFCKWEPLAEGK